MDIALPLPGGYTTPPHEDLNSSYNALCGKKPPQSIYVRTLFYFIFIALLVVSYPGSKGVKKKTEHVLQKQKLMAKAFFKQTRKQRHCKKRHHKNQKTSPNLFLGVVFITFLGVLLHGEFKTPQKCFPKNFQRPLEKCTDVPSTYVAFLLLSSSSRRQGAHEKEKNDVPTYLFVLEIFGDFQVLFFLETFLWCF
jgi:hypothetical protein